MSDFYTIKEFAQKANCCEKTVRRMIKYKTISAFRLGEKNNGRYRIPKSELLRLCEEFYVRKN